MAILYVKLTAVLGVSWLLCLSESFIKKEFLSYTCVILNSLQGNQANTIIITCLGGNK